MDSAYAWTLFNLLPNFILPPLPHGYQWARANNNYSVIRNKGSQICSITLILYGPDNTNYINFICQIDNITTYSFAQTKTGVGPKNRDFPMSTKDYQVTGYNYSGKKYKSHIRGHLIDHQDTILHQETKSTYDFRNFIPEPPEYEWGLGFRRLKVDQLRKQPGGGAYAQFNTYFDRSFITSNGTKVPDDVRIYTYNKCNGYTPQEVYHVEFEENMYRPSGVSVLQNAAYKFATSISASPMVYYYDAMITDRGLRAHVRSSVVKEANIGTSLAPSRFIYKDKLYSACESGDREFETAGRQLHAGVCANYNPRTSVEYLKRAMFFGDTLTNLDEGISFTKDEKVEGMRFFKTDIGKYIDNTEELVDHFKQLCDGVD